MTNFLLVIIRYALAFDIRGKLSKNCICIKDFGYHLLTCSFTMLVIFSISNKFNL